jgi:hypothetical protein
VVVVVGVVVVEGTATATAGLTHSYLLPIDCSHLSLCATLGAV